MIEAISESVAIATTDYSTVETTALLEEVSLNGGSSVGSSMFEEDDVQKSSPKEIFFNEIVLSMHSEEIALLIYNTLLDNGLTNYEKRLGIGGFGCVFQVDGQERYEGEKLAIKLIPQAPNWWFWEQQDKCNSGSPCETASLSSEDLETYDESVNKTQSVWNDKTWDRMSTGHPSDASKKSFSKSYTLIYLKESNYSPDQSSQSKQMFWGAWSISLVTEKGIIGDGIALNFPKNSFLSNAYGVLLFDGQQVQYVESVDVEKHCGQAIIGVVSPVIEGGSLYQRVTMLPVDSEAVRGFGKNLAEAIHELHGEGYVHRDLHPGNMLLVGDRKDPYFIQLIDFGLAKPVSEVSLSLDWKTYVLCMEWLNNWSEDPIDNKLEDLLYDPEGVLSRGVFTYFDEEEILHHPYFA